jgi:hypothetical protein
MSLCDQHSSGSNPANGGREFRREEVTPSRSALSVPDRTILVSSIRGEAVLY